MPLSRYFITICFITALLLGGCKNSNKTPSELDLMHDKVMVIHDEVMPKMRDIYQLRKKLKRFQNNDQAEILIKTLEEADDAMMDWMAQYKKPKAASDNYAEYLQAQMVSIRVVKDQMLDAIESAQNFLDQ